MTQQKCSLHGLIGEHNFSLGAVKSSGFDKAAAKNKYSMQIILGISLPSYSECTDKLPQLNLTINCDFNCFFKFE